MVRIPYIRDKIIDEKIEKLLRQLGFKPNQVFSVADFEERVCLLFNVLKPDEKAALINRPIEIAEKLEGPQSFFEFVLDEVSGSNLVQIYFRFISEAELKDLKEMEGRL